MIKSDCILKVDSFLIICSVSASTAYNFFGTTLVLTGFPALDNSAGMILLLAPDDRVIHAVRYDLDEYGNGLKARGGWSLEMVSDMEQSPNTAFAQPPFFERVNIRLPQPMHPDKLYTLTANRVCDFSGNEIGPYLNS
jgi:hypothetical protein